MPHFEPYEDWVPQPLPHREVLYARGMYYRSETLMVQTPDFWDLSNQMKEVISRNDLIFRVKAMCAE
jgi:hypothetical protein